MDLLVVHLNDQTTEALFNESQKYVLRTQARNQTMFFVKGTALRDVTLDLDFLVNEREVLRDTNPVSDSINSQLAHRLTTVSIHNWENGTELAEGDEFLGILTIDKLIPPGTTVVVTTGSMRFAFDFSEPSDWGRSPFVADGF